MFQRRIPIEYGLWIRVRLRISKSKAVQRPRLLAFATNPSF